MSPETRTATFLPDGLADPCTGPPDGEPSFSSSVHPEESPSHHNTAQHTTNADDEDESIAFRHAGWRLTRRSVRRAMAAARLPQARLDRFDGCGCSAWLCQATNPAGQKSYRIVADFCHDRLCIPCAISRAASIRANVRAALTNGPYRLLTLTLRHTSHPLDQQIKRLYLSFSRLRRIKLWRDHVIGGLAVLEVKHGDSWHPHLHVLFEGDFLPQPDIKAAWLRITGDSSIVDLRHVGSGLHAARYVTKYLTKPLPHCITHDEQLCTEFVAATEHRKLILTFGCWRQYKLTAHHVPDDHLKPICPLSELLSRARDGEPFALAVLESLQRKLNPWQPRSPPIEDGAQT